MRAVVVDQEDSRGRALSRFSLLTVPSRRPWVVEIRIGIALQTECREDSRLHCPYGRKETAPRPLAGAGLPQESSHRGKACTMTEARKSRPSKRLASSTITRSEEVTFSLWSLKCLIAPAVPHVATTITVSLCSSRSSRGWKAVVPPSLGLKDIERRGRDAVLGQRLVVVDLHSFPLAVTGLVSVPSSEKTRGDRLRRHRGAVANIQGSFHLVTHSAGSYSA